MGWIIQLHRGPTYGLPYVGFHCCPRHCPLPCGMEIPTAPLDLLDPLEPTLPKILLAPSWPMALWY